MEKTFFEHHFGKLIKVKGITFICIGHINNKDLYLATKPIRKGISYYEAQKGRFRCMTVEEGQHILRNLRTIDTMLRMAAKRGIDSAPLKTNQNNEYIWTNYCDPNGAITLDVNNDGGNALKFGTHFYFDSPHNSNERFVYRPVITF